MPKFPKSARISKRSDFDVLLKKGFYFGDRTFGIRWFKEEKRRLGIVVSKAIAKATQRNRIKRIVREVFRSNSEKFPKGDVIVIARGGLNHLVNRVISQSLLDLLEKNKR